MKRLKNISFSKHIFTFQIIVLLFLSVGCDKEKANPYIKIKDDNAKEIKGDTIAVSINSVHQTLFEVVYLSGTPRYLRQINEGDIEDLNHHKDYQLLSHGKKQDGNDFQKVVITTSFADTIVNVGSIVKVSARVGTDVAEAAYYKISQVNK